MRCAPWLAAALFFVGCPDTHDLGRDAGPTDARGPDTLSLEVGPPDAISLEHVTCGPNRCAVGEICCNESCGVCAFASECVDHGCAGP
ncbi:MAG: hypothetical protein J0L92_12635 [Deltaproteobacteria bacterium]|nr:hypothetical protein [Deltaproteobacteria bacterium]